MTRRTSVYTLSFDGGGLEFVIRAFAQRGYVITGSGPDPRPYVMFRTTAEEHAVTLAQLFPSLKNPTLTTGQGTHTRTINLKGTTMSTKTTYEVLLSDGTGCGTRARKEAAVKLGELQEQPFTVVSQPSGTVVYDSNDLAEGDTPVAEAPAPAEPTKEKTVTKKTAAAKPAKETETVEEREGTEIEFEGLGKYYAKCAGLHGAEVVGAVYGVEASLKGSTITLYGSDEDIETVAGWLRSLWPAAKGAHRVYRKEDGAYSSISKDRKDADANAQRWDLEVKWFTEFMNGAAAELAGTAKRKGGAYKDGVLAVQNPEAPAEDDADSVI